MGSPHTSERMSRCTCLKKEEVKSLSKCSCLKNKQESPSGLALRIAQCPPNVGAKWSFRFSFSKPNTSLRRIFASDPTGRTPHLLRSLKNLLRWQLSWRMKGNHLRIPGTFFKASPSSLEELWGSSFQELQSPKPALPWWTSKGNVSWPEHIMVWFISVEGWTTHIHQP